MKTRDPHAGLAVDLARMNRRDLLRCIAAGVSLIPLVGCGSESGTDAGPACTPVPEEGPGPFPGDGSNGPNALASSGIVRGDLRSSFGTMTGTAEGVPLTLELRLVGPDCAPMAGHAIYVWHCDRDGKYSLYDLPDQNYLRGVQETDVDGRVTFTSIYPACYAGFWPHIHLEIYPSLASATVSANQLRTTQLAMPPDICAQVYATSGYEQSIPNLAGMTLGSDLIFRDGYSLQLPDVRGNPTAGYVGSIVLGA